MSETTKPTPVEPEELPIEDLGTVAGGRIMISGDLNQAIIPAIG